MKATRVTPPPAFPARTSRERFGNWLGLMALLAGSVAFTPVHTAPPPAGHAINSPAR